MQLTTVYTTFAMIGFHQWPEAPEAVAYLRNLHRHKFNFRVEVSVDGPDREIEYHMMKRALMNALWDTATDAGIVNDESETVFGAWSCETIADRTMDLVRGLYPRRNFYSVEVNEDGENGSIIKVLA